MFISYYGNSETLIHKKGLKAYITEEKDEKSSLGLAKFSTTAATMSNLTNDERQKEDLRNIVEGLNATERTSIGAGLSQILSQMCYATS